MTQPLISIVINNYNYGRFLADAIESALGQTYPRVEVLVVDDGSTDDSRNVIARFGRQVVPLLKSNGGQASTFNAGFQASRGEIVIFLDADDYLLPQAAEKACQVLGNSSAIKVHWPLQEVTSTGRQTGTLRPLEKLVEGDVRADVIRRGPVSLPQPPTSGNAWTCRFLQQVLPLPEHEDKHGADGFLRKLAPFFGEMRKIDEPQGCYRIHGENHGGGRSLLFRFRRALNRYPAYCQLAAAHLHRMGVPVESTDWMKPGSEYAWLRDAVALHKDIAEVVPGGETFVLVDDDMLGATFLPDYRVLPFLEKNGQFWGPPCDDQHALNELNRMQRGGVRYFVVAYPAFWWFDVYPGLQAHLRDNFTCLIDNSRCVVFDLGSGRRPR